MNGKKRKWLSGPPAIIKPERRIIKSGPTIGFTGRFVVELIHRPSGLIKQRLEFPNMIVDSGLNRLGEGAGLSLITAYIGVGTGSNEPVASDTSLQNQVGSRSNDNGGIADTDSLGPNFDWWERTRAHQISTEVSGDVNLTEVGIFESATGGVMVVRQLFRDEVGNPITIVKTAEDVLRVYHTIRVWSKDNNEPITQNFSVDGVSTDTSTRRARVNNVATWGTAGGGILLSGLGFTTQANFRNGFSESNVLPSITGDYTGTAASLVTWAAYTAGNFYRDVEMLASPGTHNFDTGVGGVIWFRGTTSSVAGGRFVTVFDPKIAKDNTMRLIFEGRVNWMRGEPPV